MIRVCFDHQIFTSQQFGGISRYYVELFSAIRNNQKISPEIAAPLHINSHLADSGLDLPGIRLKASKFNSALSKRVDYLISSLQWQIRPPHVVHETYYSPGPISRGRTKRCITVLDMIHEKFPDSFPSSDQTAERKKQSVKRADHIFCISESTQNDLIQILGVDPKKTSITYLSHSLGSASNTPAVPLSRPYILFVGPRQGYKNFSLLLQAYADSADIRASFDLICVGGPNWSDSERLIISNLKNGSIQRHHADDGQLANYYRQAALFAYPSKYEGFGIPPLEAMSVDCPVICSRGGSLAEVVGDAAEIFDPESLGDIQRALRSVLFSTSRREKLVSLGRERIKKFSWEKCAAETAQGYLSLF